MYIKSVEITDFKSVKSFSMSFENPAGWHVIIGNNGAGKSTILQAIALTIIGSSDSSIPGKNLESFINFGSLSASIELEIQKHDDDSYTGNSRPRKSPFTAALQLTRSKFSETGELVKGAKIQSIKSDYAKKSIWSSAKGWFSASYGPYRRFDGGNISWQKTYYSHPNVAAHISVFGADVALTEGLTWLIKLNHESLEGNEESKDFTKKIISFLNQGDFLPNETKIDGISSDGLQVIIGNDSDSGTKINALDLSDGYRSILSMTIDILRQMTEVHSMAKVFEVKDEQQLEIGVKGVVMIDEIDVHLHPTWQTRIGDWFMHYFPKIQFIVTTHSPLICRASTNGTIWRLAVSSDNRESGEVIGVDRDRLIQGNILDAYGTHLFGKSPVESASYDKNRSRLGELNALSALGKIEDDEEIERKKLQKLISSDDPTGF